ncbi:hypothetical protein GH714_015268 [Hevea brasiliensis]|uniref:Beta-glucosidase n=1 Tax=Hevea brasiliensis TaxID=3981 RepID=A0A6A6MZL1_HEVBR|nr:hypothetical protein GH714_015268 [Hevea brasiliensis]
MSLLAHTKPAMADDDDDDIPADFSRSYFPEGFIFGTATSAYQEDIKNVKNMGFDAFRFSISWPRVIPSGRRREGVNQQGIDFYNSVIDEIIKNDLRPFVTIFHWDTPQALEYKYGGFLSPNIVDDYRDYADLLFDEFGDRVKYWMTFNEPWALSGFAYDDGVFALGIRSLLNYTKNKYDDLVIYITENGVDNANNETQPISDALKDQFRIDYYQKHMWKALESLNNDDVKLGGYFAWSYLDNFEWNIGYTSRFGLYYVDYKNNLTRYEKDSAKWFTKFLNNEVSKKSLPLSKTTGQVTSGKSRKLGKYYIM